MRSATWDPTPEEERDYVLRALSRKSMPDAEVRVSWAGAWISVHNAQTGGQRTKEPAKTAVVERMVRDGLLQCTEGAHGSTRHRTYTLTPLGRAEAAKAWANTNGRYSDATGPTRAATPSAPAPSPSSDSAAR